ncbi:hypothetical protein CIL05_06995 [Virgibacillus profundi]|uniref:Uncharacterized protein n=1 Tax=Virgibacillus profundi TaxID=2024555 RepID=A0A2A2IFW7_9BACI|nr:hypothetical protein [Virgibacillus profundi]PAV30206.1 hypothetical protein CIL05_06995 [Virgibacillus profundi]PXY54378.1 hypothetical protein CIT14_07080 [Virgibacillus profundi]
MNKDQFTNERVCKLLDEKGNWKYTVKAIYDGRGFYKWCILALAKHTTKSKWAKLNKKNTLEIYE